MLMKKKNECFRVDVFSTKVLTEDTIFTSPSGDGTTILRSHPKVRKGLAVCRARKVPSFFRYFKALSIGPAPGIEPTTSHSALYERS